MDYINYVKEYPMMGQIGLGGGAFSLGRYSGSAGAEAFRGDRAVLATSNNSGSSPGASNYIRYFNIASLGNGANFGNLTTARANGAGCSGGGGADAATRAVWGGGNKPDPPGPWGARSNVLDYITIASTGNATDFGDLSYATNFPGGCCSNGIRGIYGNGFSYAYSPAYAAAGRIDKFDIATTGNATSFGNIVASPSYQYNGSACAGDDGRGIFGATTPGARSIYYVQIDTDGDASSFGQLFHERSGTASCSDGDRGTWWGNQDNGAIDYITIATTANASDFGDMYVNVQRSGGAANDTRGTVSGGNNDDGYKQTIQYITIQTTGNAQNFGNLGITNQWGNSCSGE